MNIKLIKARYLEEKHGADIVSLLNSYAQDPMGGGEALNQYVIDNLIQELAKLPHAFTVLCYVNDIAAGLINCFEAFSTFSCKPLINIHDVIVLKEYRGNGLSQNMLAEVEKIAKSKGCCKLTLEVLSKNAAAQASYEKYGFTQYELDPKMGSAEFWHKLI
ncbi:MAG TPA: GNAT family N-acetyltransferase [Gammaproteobacteria bacterium]|nr:GNAT family N-acetyltransferase [Gammaproteobacteria bacterium]